LRKCHSQSDRDLLRMHYSNFWDGGFK